MRYSVTTFKVNGDNDLPGLCSELCYNSSLPNQLGKKLGFLILRSP
jgi:hypothetical protein